MHTSSKKIRSKSIKMEFIVFRNKLCKGLLVLTQECEVTLLCKSLFPCISPFVIPWLPEGTSS